MADLFTPPRPVDAVAIDDRITAALRAGAWIVYNLSGGKDSGALAKATDLYLDSIGHPRSRRLCVHADLGRAEWRSTPATVQATADLLQLPLDVVRRGAGDMVSRWEQRFVNGKRRYRDLETYNLIGPWSSASLRFCTSELKAQVIGPHLSRKLRGERIVQVLGIRREEGASGGKRKNAPISAPDHRYAKPGNAYGTEMMLWHPGVEWLEPEVFDCHARHNIPLHEAYTSYGSTRLSCAFCILASIRDLRAAASAVGNAPLYRHLVEMEASSSFSFQPDRWLADVAPSLLSPALAAAVERGKRNAAERQGIERAMPRGLRYTAGWPPRAPTAEEAGDIAIARGKVLAHHGLDNIYATPRSIVGRFEQLIAERDAKALAA